MQNTKRRRNFPGKVNARRIAALARIEAQLSAGMKRVRFGFVALSAEDRSRLEAEGDTLALRIKHPTDARNVRTKKRHADRFARRAA